MSHGGCLTLFKTRQSHAARFSFMPFGHEVTGLKTYRGPKRKEWMAQAGTSDPNHGCTFILYVGTIGRPEPWVRLP
jgi:hypothetical protein